MKIKTLDIAYFTIFASLYVALVIILTPISFQAIQFRLAGMLRPGIAKKKILVIGYSMGVFIANFFSPFAGFHELIFMPIMALISGLTAYEIAKLFDHSYFIAGVVIAVIISVSVSWMLNQLFQLPIIATLPGIMLSEVTVNILGYFMYKLIDTRYSIWY